MLARVKEWLRRLAETCLPSPSGARVLAAAFQEARRREDELIERAEERRLIRQISAENAALLSERQAIFRDNAERVSELIEARQMAGVGPWRPSHENLRAADRIVGRVAAGESIRVREDAQPLVSQGAYGDIELALQNVEWRREVNLSWLEFSRWGIQQIILISRLYYIKNPLIMRAINVCAHYVFGRGVEISSPDPKANDFLRDWQQANQKTLSVPSLTDLNRRSDYDGNVFFVLFPDKQDSGMTKIRTIDATEIMEVVCNPEDADEPLWYRREWWDKQAEGEIGSTTQTRTRKAWYPALGCDTTKNPAPTTDSAYDVFADQPVYHFTGPHKVTKWHYALPRSYPAVAWAKVSKEFLENCATIKKALARIAITISTKGGQQALEGLKAQLGTTVGPSQALWDDNPPAVTGAIAGFGPGTTMKPFASSGEGGNPEEVRRFIHMVAMAFDLPEHFFADVTVGARATAETLDRPTELAFMEKQERWRGCLLTLAKYALKVSMGAENGALREAGRAEYRIIETQRIIGPDGYSFIAAKRKLGPKEIEVDVTFPAIREGDLPQLITATATSMTLGNKGGQVIGIDEKAGVLKLMQLLGIEEAEELIEQMYPESEYEVDRTKEEQTPAILPAQPQQPGVPKSTDVGPQASGKPEQQQAKEALVEAVRELRRSIEKFRAA
jgi:hypothetical protein